MGKPLSDFFIDFFWTFCYSQTEFIPLSGIITANNDWVLHTCIESVLKWNTQIAKPLWNFLKNSFVYHVSGRRIAAKYWIVNGEPHADAYRPHYETVIVIGRRSYSKRWCILQFLEEFFYTLIPVGPLMRYIQFFALNLKKKEFVIKTPHES